MSAHTSGPWKVFEKTNQKMISSWGIEIGDRAIGFFPYIYQFADAAKTCGGYVSDPVWHANARLIAAAPDLLEALIAMETEKSDYMRRNNLGDPSAEHTNKQARAAIKKALGETP